MGSWKFAICDLRFAIHDLLLAIFHFAICCSLFIISLSAFNVYDGQYIWLLSVCDWVCVVVCGCMWLYVGGCINLIRVYALSCLHGSSDHLWSILWPPSAVAAFIVRNARFSHFYGVLSAAKSITSCLMVICGKQCCCPIIQ